MTSPDNAIPTVAYTKQTVYELQNVDPDELAGQKNADLLVWAEEARDQLFNDLLGGFPRVADAVENGVALVRQMLNQIADIFNGLVVTPINNAVQGVKEWFEGLLGFRESIEPAGYWDLEALVASADVALGVNELLVGMHLHQDRTITGIHYALAANTGTLTVQTRLDGAIVHTATINSGEVRKSYPVNVAASDKQRVSWNVTGSTGVATVLSVAVTGEYR